MIYPTARAVLLAALGVPLVLVLPGFWLVGVVWLFLATSLVLLDAVLGADPSRVTVEANLPAIMGAGRAKDIAFSAGFAGLAPREAEFTLDVGQRLRAEPTRLSSPVSEHAASARFSLVPLRRGEGRLERLWIRWRGPLGLTWKQRVNVLDKDVPIVPDIESVKEEAVQLFQRDASHFGLRVQLRAGDGAEFHALKAFQPGMERRTIDWKQTARHGHLLAREFQAEENLHLVFALDTGRLMYEPLKGQPRIDRALKALLLLSYVGLKSGDRVGLFAFDERVRLQSGTVSGPAAFPLLHRLAAQIDYSTAETNFTLGLTQLAGALDHRSIVIVFTEFADTTSAELMLDNVTRLLARHLVVFVAFRDEELETMLDAKPETPDDVSRAVIADSVLSDRELVIVRLRRLGVDVIDAPVEEVDARLLRSYLAIKRRGVL